MNKKINQRVNPMNSIWTFMFLSLFVAGCTPTIAVRAPEKPLVINLNVKIDHQIRIKVDKELDSVMDKNDDIF